MKTCTFLGHPTFMDNSAEEKINNAIKEVLIHEDEMNFIFLSPAEEYNDFLKTTWVYHFQKTCLSIVNSIQKTNMAIGLTQQEECEAGKGFSNE